MKFIPASRTSSPRHTIRSFNELLQRRGVMTKSIEAVAERADFGPAYDGEDYVTLTFRVRKEQAAIPGIWDLTPRCAGMLDWAVTKYPDKADAREAH